jgi:hypothetical protein
LAHAGSHPHRRHRPIGVGAGQQLVGVVAEMGEDGPQVGLAERPHRPARPVVEGPQSRAGHRRSFLLVLAGGPLRASPATLLARSRLVGAFAGGLVVPEAVGGALLGVDPLDGGASPLPVGPLDVVVGLGAEGPVRIRDAVGVSVLLDLSGSLAPHPPTRVDSGTEPSASRT